MQQIIVRSIEFGIVIPALMILIHEKRPLKGDLAQTVFYSSSVGAAASCISPQSVAIAAIVSGIYAASVSPDEHTANLKSIDERLRQVPALHNAVSTCQKVIESMLI